MAENTLERKLHRASDKAWFWRQTYTQLDRTLRFVGDMAVSGDFRDELSALTEKARVKVNNSHHEWERLHKEGVDG